MASPQPTDSHTRISNELYTQILMRDFTKRQRAILDLIIRLSYGCGKKTAYIKMAQFHVCGVDKYHVKKELKSLLKINVIGWDDNSCEFWIQKNYDLWKIEPPAEDIKSEMNYLIKLNITDIYQNGNNGGYQIGNSSDESYQNGNSEVTKTVTKKLPKWEPKKSETPCPVTDDEVPITKDNYLDIKDKKIDDDHNKSIHQYMLEIIRTGQEIFSPYGISQNTAYDLADLLAKEQLPVELGNEALSISKKLAKDEGFAKAKLRRWLQSNVKDVESAKRFEDEVFGAKNQTAAGGDPNATRSGYRKEIHVVSTRARSITGGRVGKV